jgi:hypothetical protein
MTVSTGCSSSAAATSNPHVCTYIQRDNQERPHRGLALNRPEPPEIERSPGADVNRRDPSAASSTSTTEAQPEGTQF